jgi:hypothetical protein
VSLNERRQPTDCDAFAPKPISDGLARGANLLLRSHKRIEVALADDRETLISARPGVRERSLVRDKAHDARLGRFADFAQRRGLCHDLPRPVGERRRA